MKNFAIVMATALTLFLGGLASLQINQYFENIRKEERKKVKEAYEQQIESLVQNVFDSAFYAGVLYAKNECRLAFDSIAQAQYENGYRRAASDMNIHYDAKIKKIHQEYKDSQLAMQIQYDQLISDTIRQVREETTLKSKQKIKKIIREITDLYKQEVLYAGASENSKKDAPTINMYLVLQVLFLIVSSTLLGAALVGFWTKRRRRKRMRI